MRPPCGVTGLAKARDYRSVWNLTVWSKKEIVMGQRESSSSSERPGNQSSRSSGGSGGQSGGQSRSGQSGGGGQSGGNMPTMAEIQEHLSGLDYPADKERIIAHARRQGAPRDVMEALEQLDGRRNFNSPIELSEGFGERERSGQGSRGGQGGQGSQSSSRSGQSGGGGQGGQGDERDQSGQSQRAGQSGQGGQSNRGGQGGGSRND